MRVRIVTYDVSDPSSIPRYYDEDDILPVFNLTDEQIADAREDIELLKLEVEREKLIFERNRLLREKYGTPKIY